MGAFTDYLDAEQAAPTQEPEAPLGEFSKSLRAGVYGARSQLHSAAGLTAEALGYNDFAKNRAADATALQAQAQENAPRIGSYKQVLDSPTLRDGLRNAGDYVTGLVGSSLPVMGAGIIGGLATGGAGAIPAMLGAAAATAPFEMGDIAQKQLADPEAMKAPVGTRLRDMAVGGLASAGVQSLVPGLVAGKLLGHGAQAAAGRSLKGIVGRNALDIPMEGITEGSGEAIKQYASNQAKPFDWDAIAENAVGGAAAGGAFGAAGAGADLAHGRAAAVGNALGSARTSINDRLAAAKTAAVDVGTAAVEPKTYSSVGDDLGALFGKGRAAVSDAADRIFKGRPLADDAEFAAATPERAAEMMKESDASAGKMATDWVNQMATDAGLTPERRQAMADLAQNAGTQAGQVAVAGAKKVYDAGLAGAKKVSDLYDSFKAGAAAEPGALPVKKSEDYSGVDQRIAQQIAPLLVGREDLAGRPDTARKLAASLRQTIGGLPNMDLNSDTIFRLIDTLGADTVPTLTKAYRAMTDNSAADAEGFFTKLNQINELQQRTTKLNDLVGQALTPEAQGVIRPEHYGDLVRGLVGYARGENVSPNAGPQQLKARDAEFRALMTEHFGDNADAVSLAIEKEAGATKGKSGHESDVNADGSVKSGQPAEGGVNADGDVVTAEKLDTIVKGRGPKNEAVMHPDLFKSNNEPGQNYAAQYLLDMKAAHPDRDVRFQYEEGSQTHGHVVAEKAADPEGFTAADLEAMKLDKKYPNSPDKLVVGGMNLDTKRIAKAMASKKLPYTEGDDQSYAHRQARMFTEGVARLTEKHGTFVVPDKAVIGQVGGKDFTWGEAQRLRSDTASNVDGRVESESADQRAKRLALKLKNVELDILDNGMTADKRAEHADVSAKIETAGAADRVARDLEGRGISQRGKDEQVHQAAVGAGVNQEPHASNMDGSAHSHAKSDRATKENFNGAVAVAKSLQRDASALVRKAGERLATLIASAHSMSAKDRRLLAKVNEEMPANKVLETTNPLARKYKDVIVAPGVEAPSPIKSAPKKIATEPAKAEASGVSLLEKAIAKRVDYMDNPPENYSTEVVKGHLDWATRQKERVDAEVAKMEKQMDDREFDHARYDALSDMQSSLRLLAESAKDQIQNDKDMAQADRENGTNLFGGNPDPKPLAAKKAAFLERAASGDKALLKELSESNDAKGLQRAVAALPPGKALDTANARLGVLVQDPDVAYGLQTKKYSLQQARRIYFVGEMHGEFVLRDDVTGEAMAVGHALEDEITGMYKTREDAETALRDEQLKKSAQQATGAHTPAQRAETAAYLDKVLGKSVSKAWANIPHAGEYDTVANKIRLSVTALDPLSTAHHEALHALFAQLRKTGSEDVIRVLEQAAQSPHALAQMREIFKNEPAVLKQLADPEERAAYMYQLYSNGQLKVGPAVKTLFDKIADAIRKVLGIWSNDERALHIMDYFSSGEYAQAMGSPSAVRNALMAPGRNQAVEVARSFTAPLARLADATLNTGSARLRDTGIPALNTLADLIKREHTTQGGDQGFIPAARIEATKRRTALGEALAGRTAEELQAAMHGLQNGRGYSGENGPAIRSAQAAIKALLQDTRDYMVKAGVEVGDLGPDYFPRVWDSHYISKHLTEFKDMLEPYVRSGQFKGSVDEFIQRLSTREGNEFGIETRMPGMQFAKERLLSFIKPEDAAMFVSKDLFGTLNSYISQATRRAEWNRRLGDGKLAAIMSDAKNEGATPAQLQTAENYLKGVDGTLGDTINPHLRRLYGNMIVYQNVRLLPMAMFSSLIDPMGVMVRGGDLRDAWHTFKRGMAEIPESFGRAAKGDEGTRLAELVGVVDSAMLSSTMGDMYTQGMVGGTAQKINNAFFKYNLMEGMTRSFRVGASEAAMKFIAIHADGTRATHSKRWINELGLQAGDVKMTPDGRIALTEGEGLSVEQVQRVHAAVNQWVDGAMLRPDAADKPIWMNDPHYALIAHLKQFVYSFQKNILGRVVHEAKAGNYTPAVTLASYVPMMMAADFAKGLLQGGGDQPEWKKGWDMADYVGYGVQRGGLLGVSQFGLDVAKDVHRGGLGAGALAGPTLEQFADSVKLLGGHKQFGPFVLDAMPANALYAHSLGGASKADPMFAD